MKLKEITKTFWFKILLVSIFAIAMAYLEAAIVIYLRTLFKVAGEIQTIQPKPQDVLIALPFFAFLQPHHLFTILPESKILGIELFRQGATILMLLTFSWLVGRSIKEKLAIFLYTFAIWDIFYYLFLYLILGWPTSLKTLDVLFLVPVPWVAPVFVPLSISGVMIIISVYLLRKEYKE